MNPEAQALLHAEEALANARINEINRKIGLLLYERTQVEQNTFRIVDLIIEHSDIVVEVPMQVIPPGV